MTHDEALRKLNREVPVISLGITALKNPFVALCACAAVLGNFFKRRLKDRAHDA